MEHDAFKRLSLNLVVFDRLDLLIDEISFDYCAAVFPIVTRKLFQKPSKLNINILAKSNRIAIFTSQNFDKVVIKKLQITFTRRRIDAAIFLRSVLRFFPDIHNIDQLENYRND